MRGEAGEDGDGAASVGLHLDHRAVFSRHFGIASAQACCGHAQRPEQHAQRVEVMDQDFGDQHALFPAHEGLPLQRRAQSIRSRQHARGEQRQLRLFDLADAALAQPGGRVAIVAAEPPVLVNHQPGLVFDLGGEFDRLLQIRRERFLAEHGQASFRGKPHQGRMELARGCDIDGVELGRRTHCLGIGVDFRNPELIRAPRGVFAGWIGDRNHARPVGDIGPRDQMMAAHHAGADQANA